MAISHSNAVSVSAPVSTLQPPAPKADKQPERQPEQRQDSAVVKLSDHAQQMKKAENQDNNAKHGQTGPKEKVEPSGIRFMEGKSKGGHVNTFA